LLGRGSFRYVHAVLGGEGDGVGVCGIGWRGANGLQHVYFDDGRLGLKAEEVESVVELKREGGEGWERALEEVETWLVD
jgi:hypothetical protein